MDVVALIGRIVFTLAFLGSGVAHLTATQAMAGYASSKKVPQATLVVQASGIWILVGAALLILGIWPDLGALMLALFLLTTAVVMHNFWTITEPEAKQLEQIQFFKDLSLGGGALALFALYAADPHPGLNLVGPLF